MVINLHKYCQRSLFKTTIFSMLLVGFLFIGISAVSAANPAAYPPKLSKITATMTVGDQLNIKITNATAGIKVWSDVPVVKTTLVGLDHISITAVKEGQANVIACNRVVYCTSMTIIVNKKIQKIIKQTNPSKKVSALPAKKTIKKVPVSNAAINKKTKINTLALSQTNVTVQKEQSFDIFVQDSDSVTAISDSAVVRTAVNSNTVQHSVRVTIYGVKTGSANVKICDPDSLCATAHVKVTPNNSGEFMVSQKNLTIYSGDSYWLTTINATDLNVLSSNPWIVDTNIVNKHLIFVTTRPHVTGNVTLKICSGPQSPSSCVLAYVNVIAKADPPYVHGSYKSVTIEEGQTIDIPFPSNFVLSYNIIGPGDPTETSVASIKVNNNSFRIVGKSYGTTVFQFCEAFSGGACDSIGVAVTRLPSCHGAKAGILALSDTNVTMKRTQEFFTVDSSNCNGLVALSNDQDIVRTAVSGNKINLYPTSVGETTIDVCDASGICIPLSVKIAD